MTLPGLEGLRFHHVGLACRRLAVEQAAHEALGFRLEGPVFHDPLQRVRGCFMVHGDNAFRIELLEPADEHSPLDAVLRRGVKMYHQCFETPDLPRAIAALEAHGAHLVSPPTPAVAFDGRPIAFVMLRTLMLVELVALA